MKIPEQSISKVFVILNQRDEIGIEKSLVR